MSDDRQKLTTPDGVEVELDAATIAKFEDLPDGGAWRQGHNWTAKEDAILLKYWPIKRHSEVARLLKVAQPTALKRYRELTGQ